MLYVIFLLCFLVFLAILIFIAIKNTKEEAKLREEYAIKMLEWLIKRIEKSHWQ